MELRATADTAAGDEIITCGASVPALPGATGVLTGSGDIGSGRRAADISGTGPGGGQRSGAIAYADQQVCEWWRRSANLNQWPL